VQVGAVAHWPPRLGRPPPLAEQPDGEERQHLEDDQDRYRQGADDEGSAGLEAKMQGGFPWKPAAWLGMPLAT
jgi:hypothetical protein